MVVNPCANTLQYIYSFARLIHLVRMLKGGLHNPIVSFGDDATPLVKMAALNPEQ